MSKGGIVLPLVLVPQEGRPHGQPVDLLKGVRPGRLLVLYALKQPAWEGGPLVRQCCACSPSVRLWCSDHIRHCHAPFQCKVFRNT